MLSSVGALEMLLIGAFLLGGIGAFGVIVWAMKRESKLNSAGANPTPPHAPRKGE